MKAGFLILDYLLWLLLDISKFKIVRKSKIKKVLVTHQGAIGELLITTPILRTLKDRLGCEIVYMAPKGKAAIFENNPDVDKIVGFEDSFEANLKKIKKEKFDLALIVQAHFKIAYMCWKAGIPYRIGGFGGLNRAPSLFFTRKTFPLKGTHSIEKNLAIINTIGLDNKNPRYRAVVSTRERSSIKQKLKKLGIDRFFIVHPGFGSPKDPDKSRLWPVKRYSDLVNHLIDKYDTKIILGVGVKEEKNLTEKILSGVKRKNRDIFRARVFGLRIGFFRRITLTPFILSILLSLDPSNDNTETSMPLLSIPSARILTLLSEPPLRFG